MRTSKAILWRRFQDNKILRFTSRTPRHALAQQAIAPTTSQAYRDFVSEGWDNSKASRERVTKHIATTARAMLMPRRNDGAIGVPYLMMRNGTNIAFSMFISQEEKI